MSKIYHLDTNICVAYLRGRNLDLRKKVDAIDRNDIKLSALVKGELLFGAYKSGRIEKNLKQTLDFCSLYEIIPFDDFVLDTYGQIRAALELKGQKIGANDTIIAATALAHNATFVTNNVKEFSRIEGLLLEDWTQ
ncbi:MAG: type II toxin-antitoxin system VapC family toxin [Synergistaceae bacterium]|nr:type II toxin-antitoxin system VapC family toxin [Synergistaceae bacterium]